MPYKDPEARKAYQRKYQRKYREKPKVKKQNKQQWVDWYKNNKDARSEYNKKYWEENKGTMKRDKDPRLQMLHLARHRAKKKDLPFNIDLEDIVIPDRCPLLDIELKVGEGKRSDASPSLDKIIPELGYVKGNVQVISCKANLIKNNATPEELLKIATALMELLSMR